MQFREEIHAFNERLAEKMPRFDCLTWTFDNSLRKILVTYREVFSLNFIPWIELVRHRCKSSVAYDACYDNLLCEIAENHPLMLRTFVSCDSGEEDDRLDDCHPLLCAMTAACCNDTMEGLLILAALGNASLVVIPWMKRAADTLELANREYLERHCIADIAHAEGFLNALEAEAPLHPPKKLLGIAYVERLLQTIFSE